MSDLFIVAKFTLMEMIRKKSFLISTFIILIIIVIGCNIPNILNRIKGEDQSSGTKILLVDSSDIFEGSLEMLNSEETGYEYTISNYDISKENIKERIDNEEIDSCIIITKGDNTNIKLEYFVDSISMYSYIPEDIVNKLSSIYTNIQISKLGLSEEQLANISPMFSFDIVELNEAAAGATENLFTMMMLCIVLFYAIYFCAYQVSSSITTEKTSKIMETLVTSTSPKTIVVGKTLGIGLVGLIQVLVIVIVGVLSAWAFLPSDIVENLFDLSTITPSFAILGIVYFILGYILYAFLYALTGSTVSKPEDISSANTPVAFLALIGFYLAYFSMMNPASGINKFAALFPVSSSFSMPFRIMMGIATTSEIILSLVILLVTIVIIARISIKIYSSMILNYGTKVGIKDIFKIYKDKNN